MEGYVFLDIDNLAVAWETYCGRLVSVEESSSNGRIPMSSWFASRIQQDRTWLRNEAIMEMTRRINYPSQISRLRGMYFFEDKRTAIRASLEWNGRRFKLDRLAKVKFSSDSKITKVDHNWILDNMENHIDHNNQPEWIHQYWQGKTTGRKPFWELIVKGKAVILETELQKKAYETIRQKQPSTLRLLEISRIAWDMGYHFGHIAAWLVKEPSNSFFEIKYTFDANDANDDEFINKFHQYQGPKNIQDLNASEDIFKPDLRNEFFQFVPTEDELSLLFSVLQN